MKKLILAICLFAFAGPAFAHSHDANHGHLSFGGGLFHAHLSFSVGPLLSEESVLQIEFKDGATHAPIAGPAQFRVWVNMPGMDHESPDTVITPVVDEKGDAVIGSYAVNDIYFIMAGDWNVNITVTDAAGLEETQTWSLTVGDGGHDHQH